jgi:hypothetical protein
MSPKQASTNTKHIPERPPERRIGINMGKSSETDTTDNDGQSVHERLANTVVGDTDPSQCAEGASEAQAVQPKAEDVRGSSSRITRDEPAGCQEKIDAASSARADEKRDVPLYTDRVDKMVGPDLVTVGVDVVNKSQPLSDIIGESYHKKVDCNGGRNAGDTQNGESKSPSSIVKSGWVQAVHLSSSQLSPFSCNIDTSEYPPSCIVKLTPGLSSGDQMTIRWPIIKLCQNATVADKSSEVKSSKRRRADDGSPSEEDTDLLVKITLPTKLKAKMKGSERHVRVFAPWITAERAAANTLTSRQLRSIGIDGHDGCNAILRRSRRQRVRNHGEGNFSVGHSRIGDRYQVSARQIPCASTWGKELLARNESMDGGGNIACDRGTVAKNDQIWDAALSEEALSRGEPVDQYIESLYTFQKARGIMTLHRSAYNVTLSKQRFHKQTVADVPFPDAPEPPGRLCQKPHSMLEGSPLSMHERKSFNDAIHEYRKQWPKIAKAVGTSANRCLIHYYSSYKAGEGRINYLQEKKLWEQSDECEICHDGGDLICCDGCINAYHFHCIAPPLKELPVGQWFCPACQKKKTKN